MNNVVSKQQLPLTMQLLQLTDHLYDSINNDKFTINVFIDLSKEFHTVDYEILLEG